MTWVTICYMMKDLFSPLVRIYYTSNSLYCKIANSKAGYPFPHSDNTGPQTYVTPPPPAPTTDQHRVHYPPSPYMVQEQNYATIPLNDHATSREHLSPNPGYGNDVLPPMNSGGNTPQGSTNSKKRWSFLPTSSKAETFDHNNEKPSSGTNTPKRPRGPHRVGSWDLLGERAEWEEYNPAQASVTNLKFAEGDVGTNKVSNNSSSFHVS
jgi:hypothetical protein